MSWIPVSNPPPPDDFHTWARPASPPCPNCECCTKPLCDLAVSRGSACHLVGVGDYDLSLCPCWKTNAEGADR